jgi:siroheme synthase
LGLETPGLLSDSQGLIAVVGLPEMTKVPVRDWSDDFTLIVGDHREGCQSSLVVITMGQTTVMLMNILGSG